MPSISVTPTTSLPSGLEQRGALDGAMGTPKVVRPDRQRSNSPHAAERREIPSVIYRSKRDVEATRLYGSDSGAMRGMASEAALGGIRHQLRTMCAPAQALEWKPVPGVAETLSALAQHVEGATETEKAAIGAMLGRDVATATAHRAEDTELLKKAIDRTLRGEDPMEVLGDLAETSLVLPDFTIRVDGQEEPTAKHFDSTLPSFASGSYDHGPLGRTLILEGGRARFAGPSQAQRADKLREVIFALPNPPESGEPLDGMADIFQALMALGIDI